MLDDLQNKDDAYRLGLSFWLADEYKPAGYPFGKTIKGLEMWIEFGTYTTTN